MERVVSKTACLTKYEFVLIKLMPSKEFKMIAKFFDFVSFMYQNLIIGSLSLEGSIYHDPYPI